MSDLLRSMRVLTVLAVLTAVLAPRAALAQGQGRWFSAWTVSQNVRQATPALSNSTVRMFVRPAISGTSVRIKLENTLGQTPVSFSAAFIGVADSGASVVAGTNRKLAFGGRPDATLAPGAGAWSDPVDMPDESLRSTGCEPRRRVGVGYQRSFAWSGDELHGSRCSRG